MAMYILFVNDALASSHGSAESARSAAGRFANTGPNLRIEFRGEGAPNQIWRYDYDRSEWVLGRL